MATSVSQTLMKSFYQPDLPVRIAKSLPLTEGNRETYYTQGPEGYIDYPFAEKEFSRLQ